jgi:hypothetical protein
MGMLLFRLGGSIALWRLGVGIRLEAGDPESGEGPPTAGELPLKAASEDEAEES